MERPLLVYTTFPDLASALNIGEALVRARLIACINVLPGMQSVYSWKGAVERGEEVAAILKSREGLGRRPGDRPEGAPSLRDADHPAPAGRRRRCRHGGLDRRRDAARRRSRAGTSDGLIRGAGLPIHARTEQAPPTRSADVRFVTAPVRIRRSATRRWIPAVARAHRADRSCLAGRTRSRCLWTDPSAAGAGHGTVGRRSASLRCREKGFVANSIPERQIKMIIY